MKRNYQLFVLVLTIVLSVFSVYNTQAQPVQWQCNQCALVTNLTVTGTTNTTVDLSWSHPGAHCGFIIDAVDNNNGTTTTYNVSPASGSNPITYTVTGLTPLTYYTFYVRQVYIPQPGDLLMDCAPEEVSVYTTGDGLGCDCDIVHNIQFTNITNTSADISWLTNAECQDFYVTVMDMNNPSFYKTYVVLSATNLTLTGLTAGGFYRVWVRVISDAVPGVDCIPEEAYFSTTHDGIICWDCVPPLSVNVQNITSTTASLTWVAGSPCNDFEIYVFDNVTNSMQVYTVTGTSYTLTGLSPSRSYSVFVAMKSVQIPPVSCLGTQVDFSTNHCGDFTQSFSHYSQFLHLLCNGFNGVGSDIFYSPNGPNPVAIPAPYMFSNNTHLTSTYYTNNAFNFTQGGNVTTGITHCFKVGYPGGTLYVNVWLDYNNDGVFSPSERVVHANRSSTSNSSGTNCVSIDVSSTWGWNCSPCNFTVPNQAYNNIHGRCIISLNDASPCGPISDGQVLDFLVNIQ